MKSRTFVAAALATIYPALCAAQYNNCGDADGDGTVNINDVTYSLDYIVNGGPAPVDFDTADADGYDLFIINDVQWMITCAFLCDFQGNCSPTAPPLSPPLEPSSEFVYNNIIPSGAPTFGIQFGLQGADIQLESYLAVLRVSVEGAPAVIDSVVFDPTKPGSVLPFSAVNGPGSVTLGTVTTPSGPWDNDFLGKIFVTVANPSIVSNVTVAWDTLTPAMAPPEETGSLYPLFDSDDFAVGDNGYFLPTLLGSCCWNPGDFNGDKVFNISDVTAGIAFIFSGGDPPLCNLEADYDGSGAFGIGDVTAGIAFIFSGGPGPVCP